MCQQKLLCIDINGKLKETHEKTSVTITSPSKGLAEKVIKLDGIFVEIKGKNKKVFVINKLYNWEVFVPSTRFILRFYGKIKALSSNEMIIATHNKKTKERIEGLDVVIEEFNDLYHVNFYK